MDQCLANMERHWHGSKAGLPHLLGSRYHSVETSLDLLSDRVSAYIQVCKQLETEKGRRL
jgi:hypothetical protein